MASEREIEAAKKEWLDYIDYPDTELFHIAMKAALEAAEKVREEK